MEIKCNDDDWMLVQDILNGNVNSFKILLSKYQNIVFSLTLKKLKNEVEAEDCAQDIFLKAYESLSTFKGQSQFSTWLYTIAKNELILKYKTKQKGKVQIQYDEFIESKNSLFNLKTPEFQLLAKEFKEKIILFLEKLPEVYKKPIMLYYFNNMQYSEIANNLDLKINTLKSNLIRGKKILKKWMEEEYEGI